MELDSYSEGAYPGLTVVIPVQYIRRDALGLIRSGNTIIIGKEVSGRPLAMLSGLETNISVKKKTKANMWNCFQKKKDLG